MSVEDVETICFESFGVEHILKEIGKFIGHETIKTDIFRIQGNNSVMCGCFRIRFIDFIVAGKTLIDYNSLFSPYGFKKMMI